MFGFEYRLILSMFYALFQGIVLILEKFYITFQGYQVRCLSVIVCKARDSLTSVFKTCYSPDLEKADFDRESFQYTWLNSYFFSSLRESFSIENTCY